MVITIILGVLWSIAFILSLLGTWSSLKHYAIKLGPKDPSLGYFPVTILKPLKGMDNSLEQNLESFFKLDYPHFEMLFALTDTADPAYELVNRLIKKYPKVDAKIHVNPDLGFGNPKVSNLRVVYELAKNDWLLICDSNVFMSQTYLKEIVSSVEQDTGIVSSTIGGFEPKGFFGYLEATFLNGFYARWGMASFILNKPCVVGKIMLFQRSVANRFGGIQSFSNQIAEDYMMGVAMILLGKKVVMMRSAVQQRVGTVSAKHFWDRHMRWGRIRKRQAPVAFYSELLFQPLTASVTGALFFSTLFGINFWILFGSYFVFSAVSDFLVMKSVNKQTGFNFLFFWLVRELMHYALWLDIAFGNTIIWRGQEYFLERGGLVSPVLKK